MKTRFSITMDEHILKSLDSAVDGVNLRSRSEAIEKIVQKFLEKNKTAVFMGGGNPEKLKINGEFRPLVTVKGRMLIEYAIDRLKVAGFKNIFFIGHHEIISACFSKLGNGNKLGVHIKYIEEKKVLGTAKTLQLVENEINGPFLFLQIDNYFEFDVGDLFKAFTFNQTPITIGVHASSTASRKKGVIEMQGSKIVLYDEDAKISHSTLGSTTIGVCDPSIFSFIPKGDVEWHLKYGLFPKLAKENKLSGFLVPGPWFNIHDTDDVQELEKYLYSKQ